MEEEEREHPREETEVGEQLREDSEEEPLTRERLRRCLHEVVVVRECPLLRRVPQTPDSRDELGHLAREF